MSLFQIDSVNSEGILWIHYLHLYRQDKEPLWTRLTAIPFRCKPNPTTDNSRFVFATSLVILRKLYKYFANSSTMKSINKVIFTLLSTSFMLTMGDKASFVGKWKLIEAYDQELQPITLPAGSFLLELKDQGNDEDVLAISIKVGNNLRSKITFLSESEEGDNVTIAGLMSTMMMPPEPLFRLETYLSNTFPKMTLLEEETVDGKTLIVFSGEGQIVCQKVDRSE